MCTTLAGGRRRQCRASRALRNANRFCAIRHDNSVALFISHETTSFSNALALPCKRERNVSDEKQLDRWSCPYFSGHALTLKSVLRRRNIRGDSIFNAL